MSTQDQRAKFEEWLESAGFDVRRYHYIAGYHGNEQQAAWEAWQAALDSICVVLPLPETLTDDDIYAVELCRDAIHAAGVKTK